MTDHRDPRLRLCVITDDLRDGRDGLVARTVAAAAGGATMVILRLKHADAATLVEVGRALVQSLHVPLLVHERLDVALACGAAGVHLGSDSLPAVAVRTLARPGLLLGVAIGGADEVGSVRGADFVTVGPVFDGAGATLIDGAALYRLRVAVGVPSVVIGGVTPESAAELVRDGADGVAVIRAVLAAADPAQAASAFVQRMRADGGDGDGDGMNDEAPDHVV